MAENPIKQPSCQQCPKPKVWSNSDRQHQKVGEPTLTAALLERLTHKAHICTCDLLPHRVLRLLASRALSSRRAGRIFHEPINGKSRIFSLRMVQRRGQDQDHSTLNHPGLHPDTLVLAHGKNRHSLTFLLAICFHNQPPSSSLTATRYNTKLRSKE